VIQGLATDSPEVTYCMQAPGDVAPLGSSSQQAWDGKGAL